MHKTFYASGFLYHPKTHQILLQQTKSVENNRSWTLLTVDHESEDGIRDRFLEKINENLNLKLKSNSVFSVYNYIYQDKNIFIFYAVTNKLQNYASENSIYTWFSFKQVKKLSLSDQTKQDIIIGQRVIDSSIRKDLGLQTIG